MTNILTIEVVDNYNGRTQKELLGPVDLSETELRQNVRT